jgi:hypothetical protein
VPRHGIDQQVQRSSAGSTPHDRITILQICSARSLPLDRPRQSASRHPPVVTNRPTTYRVRCNPRLIQQPFHHPPACWSASTPFTHLIRGPQIPIAHAAPPTCPSRGLLPWRFAYAGPGVCRATIMGQASATLHRSGQSQIKIIRCLLLTKEPDCSWINSGRPDNSRTSGWHRFERTSSHLEHVVCRYRATQSLER